MQEKLQIAVCEDEQKDAEHMWNCVLQSEIPSDCMIFSSGEDLLSTFCAGRYDVVFMDIYLKGMRGIETAAKMRESETDTILAFTTSSLDYTLESYRLGALKYLEKPVMLQSVRETMELALLRRKSSAYISLLISGRKQEVLLRSILYFELKNHVIKIHTTTGLLNTSQTVKLNDIEKQLPSTLFLRCHHSYIVNLSYIREVDKEFSTFTLKDSSKVHIKRQSLKKASNVFEKYLYKAAREEVLEY